MGDFILQWFPIIFGFGVLAAVAGGGFIPQNGRFGNGSGFLRLMAA